MATGRYKQREKKHFRREIAASASDTAAESLAAASGAARVLRAEQRKYEAEQQKLVVALGIWSKDAPITSQLAAVR